MVELELYGKLRVEAMSQNFVDFEDYFSAIVLIMILITV